jgi:hypothetical protein
MIPVFKREICLYSHYIPDRKQQVFHATAQTL